MVSSHSKTKKYSDQIIINSQGTSLTLDMLFLEKRKKEKKLSIEAGRFETKACCTFIQFVFLLCLLQANDPFPSFHWETGVSCQLGFKNQQGLLKRMMTSLIARSSCRALGYTGAGLLIPVSLGPWHQVGVSSPVTGLKL